MASSSLRGIFGGGGMTVRCRTVLTREVLANFSFKASQKILSWSYDTATPQS